MKVERCMVAPWGSPLCDRAQWITDGEADDIEINAALEWARLIENGEVLITPGKYVLANSINVAGFYAIPQDLGTLLVHTQSSTPTARNQE